MNEKQTPIPPNAGEGIQSYERVLNYQLGSEFIEKKIIGFLRS